MTLHHRLSSIPLRAIGVDVMMIDRLSRALSRSPRLFERLCAPEEQSALCTPEGLGLFWATFLWCAKEASVKCLGTGFWRANIDWPDLVILPLGSHLSSEVELSSLHEDATSLSGLTFSVSARNTAMTVLRHDLISGTFRLTVDRGTALAHRELATLEGRE